MGRDEGPLRAIGIRVIFGNRQGRAGARIITITRATEDPGGEPAEPPGLLPDRPDPSTADDPADGCEQRDAAFGFAFELFTAGCVSELSDTGEGMTVFAAIVLEDECGGLMCGSRGRHLF